MPKPPNLVLPAIPMSLKYEKGSSASLERPPAYWGTCHICWIHQSLGTIANCVYNGMMYCMTTFYFGLEALYKPGYSNIWTNKCWKHQPILHTWPLIDTWLPSNTAIRYYALSQRKSRPLDTEPRPLAYPDVLLGITPSAIYHQH